MVGPISNLNESCYRAGQIKCSTKTDYILSAYFCFENLNILVSYFINTRQLLCIETRD